MSTEKQELSLDAVNPSLEEQAKTNRNTSSCSQ